MQAVLGFAFEHGLESTFLMDYDGAVGRTYQLYSTPTTYFIDPAGVVQDFQVGIVDLAWLTANVQRSTQ